MLAAALNADAALSDDTRSRGKYTKVIQVTDLALKKGELLIAIICQPKPRCGSSHKDSNTVESLIVLKKDVALILHRSDIAA